MGLPLVCGTQYRDDVAQWDGWFALFTQGDLNAEWTANSPTNFHVRRYRVGA